MMVGFVKRYGDVVYIERNELCCVARDGAYAIYVATACSWGRFCAAMLCLATFRQIVAVAAALILLNTMGR